MKEINTFKDALSLKAVKKASLIIKAEREGTVYPLYGVFYATTIISSSCAIESEVTEFFRTKPFKIGSDNILYKAVKNSVKIQTTKSKATALF